MSRQSDPFKRVRLGERAWLLPLVIDKLGERAAVGLVADMPDQLSLYDVRKQIELAAGVPPDEVNQELFLGTSKPISW